MSSRRRVILRRCRLRSSHRVTFMPLTRSRKPHQTETGFDQLNQSTLILGPASPVLCRNLIWTDARCKPDQPQKHLLNLMGKLEWERSYHYKAGQARHCAAPWSVANDIR